MRGAVAHSPSACGGAEHSTAEHVYEVCIIGAGPAGLSVLSALRNPWGKLKTEAQVKQWTRCKHRARARAKPPSVCVVDPGGRWLGEWRGRFRSLDIDHLRSPAWAQPDHVSAGALVEFAWTHGREASQRFPQTANIFVW